MPKIHKKSNGGKPALKILVCRFCGKEIQKYNGHQEMCKTCRTLYKMEYDRLLQKVKRDPKSIFSFFEWHRCKVCREHIDFGYDVCNVCRTKRASISEVLVKEFAQSLKKQMENKKNGKC